MRRRERVALLVGSPDEFSRTLDHDYFDIVMVADIPGEDPVDVLDQVVRSMPSLIFIDLHLPGRSEADLAAISAKPYWEIEPLFERENLLPEALSFVVRLEKVRDSLPGVLVFAFYEGAGIHLTQVLLRHGIDWVWPHRLPREIAVDKVIERLRVITGRVPAIKIWVVDNSSNDRSSIYGALGERHSVTHIRAGASEREIEAIGVEEVIEEFSTGMYDVVIMDLGLDSKQEGKLAAEILPEAQAIFQERGVEYFHEFIGGVAATKWLLENDPAVHVLILSNYIENQPFLQALDHCFGSNANRVNYLPKGQQGWSKLESALNVLLERKV